jgi:enamine deaminase RidA (YjgF/YER057c/UK114 family)
VGRATLRGRVAPSLVTRRIVSRRRLISSGGPFEAVAGYSRAVVEGDTCEVAGTTDAGPDGESLHPGDAGAQARAAFAIVVDALQVAGFSLDDVVRTRLYLVDRADVEAVLAVHGELFRDVRPAATLVLVAGLIRPSLRVEVEVTARRT